MKKYITIAMMILALILMCEKVNASTSWSVNQSRIVTEFNGTYTYSSWSNQTTAYTPTDPVIGLQYRLKVSGGAIADNSYVFKVAYKPTPDSLYATSPVIVDNNGDPRSDYVCTSFNYNTSDGYYKANCTFTPQVNMSTSDYIYVRIWFESSSYVSSLAIGLSAYDLRQGTGSIITDIGNEVINAINDNYTTECSNLYNYNNYGTSGVSSINVYNNYDVKFTGSGNVKISENLTLAKSTKYNFSYHVSSSNNISQLIGIWCIDSGGNWNQLYRREFTNTNATYNDSFYTNNTTCTNYRIEYNGYSAPNNTNFSLSNIMLSTQTGNYCEYGTTTNKLDNIESQLEQDHSYNNNASENLNGQNDLDTYTNSEDQLMQSIDLDSADTSNISINAGTSTFIWNIANLLRGIHAKIVLLMTSILGIGIMKLILNR